MFLVCWGGEEFGKDITGISVSPNSQNHHVSIEVVLSYGVVANIDAATVFVHSRLGRDVLRGLVVGVQVKWSVFVAIKLENCLHEVTSCMSS